MKSLMTPAVRGTALVVAALVLCSTFGRTQNAPATPAPGETASAVRELQEQVRQLQTMVNEMRAENAQSRAEMKELRQDLQSTRALLGHPAMPEQNGPSPVTAEAALSAGTTPAADMAAATAESAPLAERVQKLEESTSLLGSKIDEQYQTKVETSSKYRARLHGIVLMNAFRNVGVFNNLDLPDYAQAAAPGMPQTSFGATLRQTEIGMEVFGPHIAGAKTSAEVQFDFAGGFASVGDGVNFGIARLQTAALRFDWGHTSVDRGPGLPVSFAAFAYVVRIAGEPGLCRGRKSMGLDSANSSRTPL